LEAGNIVETYFAVRSFDDYAAGYAGYFDGAVCRGESYRTQIARQVDFETDLNIVAYLCGVNRQTVFVILDINRQVLNIGSGLASLDYSHLGLRLIPCVNTDLAVERGYRNRRALIQREGLFVCG